MFAALISLFLTQTLPPASGSQMWWYNDTCTRAGGRCQYLRNGRPTNNVALCDALQAGDQSGTWWCMRGDGTMKSGSAVTLTATGTPTNTTENGWPVRSYTSAQNDQEPANVAFPASDFSVCMHRRQSTTTGGDLMAFGTSSAVPTTFSVAPFEYGGTMFGITSDGIGFAPTFNGGTITANVWAVWCFTFDRIGAGTSVGTIYKDGVQVATSSALRMPQALASVWSTNGAAAASGAPAGTTASVRGVFVTYKLLSAADVARISGAVGP